MNHKIDFVLMWVDGSDPKWLEEKSNYSPEKNNDAAVNRYRDWNNLQYWFRGVENFAPWVNKIHFVTYGHTPSWLNLNHPKINIVNHKEIIPNSSLPTFNSSSIEIHINRIKELSEHFVFFNDDMFIIDEINPSYFFYNGLPCDSVTLTQLTSKGMARFKHTKLNNSGIINSHFNKDSVIKQNLFKYFNFKYGMKQNIKNLLNWLLDREFSSFRIEHLPAPYLKSTFDEVWDKEYFTLSESGSHKFRTYEDINQYVFRFWQFASGKFHPLNLKKIGRNFGVPEEMENIYSAIENQEFKLICINDNSPAINLEELTREVNSQFEKILPEKSSFEI